MERELYKQVWFCYILSVPSRKTSRKENDKKLRVFSIKFKQFSQASKCQYVDYASCIPVQVKLEARSKHSRRLTQHPGSLASTQRAYRPVRELF